MNELIKWVCSQMSIKNRQDRENKKSHIFHAKILVMKDMILNIKKKAIALDLDADYTTIENQLIDLKKQIKILDEFLDLKISDM